jgi:hypothetical protein
LETLFNVVTERQLESIMACAQLVVSPTVTLATPLSSVLCVILDLLQLQMEHARLKLLTVICIPTQVMLVLDARGQTIWMEGLVLLIVELLILLRTNFGKIQF